jgi:hypothetical protein
MAEPSRPRQLDMDDERKFEHYRLSVVQTMPDSEIKDVLLRAIRHKLAILDGQNSHESADQQDCR